MHSESLGSNLGNVRAKMTSDFSSLFSSDNVCPLVGGKLDRLYMEKWDRDMMEQLGENARASCNRSVELLSVWSALGSSLDTAVVTLSAWAPHIVIPAPLSCVWQSCWVRYLFFTSYSLARSTTCGLVSSLQVGGQSTQISLHTTRRNSASLLEKEELDL